MKKRLIVCMLVGIAFAPAALAQEGQIRSSKSSGKGMACQGVSMAYSKASSLTLKELKEAAALSKKQAR